MAITISKNLEKYVSFTESGQLVERFVCPICKFSTRLGPGALRMHIILRADPIGRHSHDKEHEEFLRKNSGELTLDSIKTLSMMPKVGMTGR